MKNTVLTIIKKELARFFGDKRMAFTTILLPGLLVFVMYNFLGEGMMDKMSTDEDYVYNVSVVNMPSSVEQMIKEMPFQVEDAQMQETDDKRLAVAEKEKDLLVVFPEGFDADVAAYDSGTTAEAAPQIEMYYNSTKTESFAVYQMMTEMFDAYEATLANKFDINSGADTYDMASDQDETGMIFSMMLPMLLMLFMFSGCMAIAPEAIAGEKERGTIATLLVTPMKRSHLALGKIISLGLIGLLSGISSFLGTMLSLPKIMGGDMENVGADVYSVSDYALLLCVILTTILLMVAAMSVLSAYSKSVKEASTAIMPLMIVIMLVSFSSIMGNGAPEQMYWYLIPFYNSVQCMNSIFSFAVIPVNIIVTVISNFVYVLLLSGGLAKMFDSEKIMYT